MSANGAEGLGGDRWRRLTRVSRAVSSATSADDILHLIVVEATELLDAAKAILMLVDEEGLLQVHGACGVDAELLARFREPHDAPLIGRLQGLFGTPETMGFLGVPLVARGQVIGILAVHRPGGGAWTDDEEELLSALADQVAAPIEVARLDAELRRGLQLAKERALATLAHDLRSPLQAIEGFATLVEEEMLGPVTSEQRRALARIRMSGRHLLALQEDMLDLARLGAQGARAHRTRASGPHPSAAADATDPTLRAIDPHVIIQEAVAIVRAAVEARGHTLVVGARPDTHCARNDAVPDSPAEVDGGAAPRLLADPDRLRRVLINLLSNAAKYTPPGGCVAIRLAVSAGPDGARWGTITVTDTGVGIAPEHREVIFQPYYRVNDAATVGIPGVGLGLAICRELIDQMGGTIAVESRPGAGSSFSVRLPATEESGR